MCLQAIYPTDQVLRKLDAQLQSKESPEDQLKAVEDDLKLRGDLTRERDFVVRDIQQLNQAYPDTHTEEIRQEYQNAQQLSDDVNTQMSEYDLDLSGKRQEIKSIEGILLEASQEHSRLQQEIAVAKTNLFNAKLTIEEKCISLPAEWQPLTTDLSEAALLTWEQEIETLQSVEEALRVLQDAQQNRQRYQERLEVLQEESARMPVEARRPPIEIEKEAEEVDERYQRFEKQEQNVRAEVSRLKELQNQRMKLEQKLAQAVRKTYLYKELARLLGRDCLQHYLLKKAEEGIVTHANEELDRISGGVLRLKLKSGTDKGGKALDLVAYNREISPLIPQSVDLLSGSQQFRVAVSLALGVGTYAGHENRKWNR
jgi:DNA repair exonuclease SbcCD ATPase subunit